MATKTPTRRDFNTALALLLGSATGSSFAQAATLKVVVGLPPGGSGDLIARVIAEEFTKATGQSAVVENRPGAGTNIASDFVSRAAPDGNTILVSGNTGHGINPWLYKKLNWDPIKDFTPITKVSTMPMVIAVTPGRQIRSLNELITKVKSEPGKWSFASPGIGTPQHLAGVQLARTMGMDLEHIPFQGGAPALAGVLSGEVPVLIGSSPVVLPQVRAGKLVPLSLISRSPSKLIPGVPGMAAAGIQDIDLDGYWGIWGPGNMRPEVTRRLFDVITKILLMPHVVERFARDAMLVEVSNSPEEFNAFYRKDLAMWGPVVKASGAVNN